MTRDSGQNEREWTRYAVRSAGFWLALGAVLIGGIVLGAYVIPSGVLPGTSDQAIVHLATIREEVIDRTNQTSADNSDVNLAVENELPALVYTVRVTGDADTTLEESCADFLGYERGGEVLILRLTEPYFCP